MNKKEFKHEMKKIKKIITNKKTRKIVKSHLIFWNGYLNNLGDAIANNLIQSQEEKPFILTINRFYIV